LFGGLAAVCEVDLEVFRGEIHAVIGPNGAGKSTLVNLLAGDLAATSGTISLNNQNVTSLSPNRRSRRGLGRSFQKATIFPGFSVGENVTISAQAKARGATSIFGTKARGEAARQLARCCLERVGLRVHLERQARDLSHGEKRQLEIAMMLAGSPSVLLLDEPLAGLGPTEANAMVKLIFLLKNDGGVLLVEHDMDAVFALADRLTVMVDGKVVASGKPGDVRSNPVVRAAYLGGSERVGL
jgi:branched-chain amino acid transport system ATP-binding protein